MKKKKDSGTWAAGREAAETEWAQELEEGGKVGDKKV